MENRPSNEKIRLLLVDDEQSFREAIARRLTKRNMAPQEASTGEECLAMLSKSPMDVVVLDVKMPGMSGIDTLTKIKEEYPETEVILLTGNAAVSDGVQGIKAGAFDYLTKPIELEHLANKIHQAFERILLAREKKREAEYRELLERKMVVTDRLASLGTLSTGIAHEINNPLAIINESAGFMKTILGKPELSGIPRRDILMSALDKIEKSIQRARKITHQLLGYVKIQDAEILETDLTALLEDTLELLKKEIKDKLINVRIEESRPGITVWSDPFQIRQVLINLLTNAIYAVSTQGIIAIAIRELKEYIAVSISDNGVGIPKENLKKIFDPFFSTKPHNEGTGLGLYVVHKILSRLNGDIEVTSTVGKGSTFTIKLPRYGPFTDKTA